MSQTPLEIHIATATAADIDFVISGIIAAEKSGSELLPYTGLFGLDESATARLISDIMEEEIEGQEWYLPHFSILYVNNSPAACLSAWTEGETGLSSGQLKAQAMAWFLGEKWMAAGAQLELLKQLQLPRLQGALQLECIYTHPAFRGQGLAGRLIEFVLDRQPEGQVAEIQLLSSNEKALHSYTKCGFLKRTEVRCQDPAILNLLPDDTRVSLVKTIRHGNTGNQEQTQSDIQ